MPTRPCATPQIAHASLDEKEKTEARLKRQQFDYKVEGNHYESILENLQAELLVLDEKVNNGHHVSSPPQLPLPFARFGALSSF